MTTLTREKKKHVWVLRFYKALRWIGRIVGRYAVFVLGLCLVSVVSLLVGLVVWRPLAIPCFAGLLYILIHYSGR